MNLYSDASVCRINSDSYDVGRVLLSISSIMFILRIIHMFISDKYLGPTVLMINKMMKDFRVGFNLLIVVRNTLIRSRRLNNLLTRPVYLHKFDHFVKSINLSIPIRFS